MIQVEGTVLFPSDFYNHKRNCSNPYTIQRGAITAKKKKIWWTKCSELGVWVWMHPWHCINTSWWLTLTNRSETPQRASEQYESANLPPLPGTPLLMNKDLLPPALPLPHLLGRSAWWICFLRNAPAEWCLHAACPCFSPRNLEK